MLVTGGCWQSMPGEVPASAVVGVKLGWRLLPNAGLEFKPSSCTVLVLSPWFLHCPFKKKKESENHGATESF